MRGLNRCFAHVLLVLGLVLASPWAWALKCDVDNNGRIDRVDLGLIQQAVLAQAAVSGPDDPRDADNNRVINAADGRICALRCKYASCASNGAPVADAGPDQTVRVGDTVSLSGAASSDPDGNALTYRWSFLSRPGGSTAALTSASVAGPRFVADRPGSYVLQLLVNDGTVNSAPDTVTVSTGNSAPVADAGPDQTAAVGATVHLSGAASSDADGNPLTYRWTLTARPAGSAATLAGANTATPSFVVDQPGNYAATLTVNDGSVDSAPDAVAVNTINSAPTANAGPDQTVRVTDRVTLSGAASSDPDGNPLAYRWSLSARPAGSAAVLIGANTLSPTFIADRPGNYTAALVVSDGSMDSATDTVTISTVNSAPRANAGPDQTARVGDMVFLDGRGSSDVDGDALAYAWRLVSAPAGSTASLSSTSALQPSFTIDRAGSYEFELTVNDGTVNGAPDRVIVSTSNSPPVARPGNDRSVPLGSTVTLDGSASSDVDGNPLSFAWSLSSRPAGSSAALSSPTSVNPGFLADRPGSYVVQLIVNDGSVNSAPATVTISTTNARPTANAGPDQTVPLGGAVLLDGSASSDPEGAPLSYAWSLSTRPAGSVAALTASNLASPGFTADRPGNYVAQLIVGDGVLNSAPDTVIVSTQNSRPLAVAGTAQAVNTGATVLLNGSASSDADGDALSYAWSLTTRPAGSAAVISPGNAVSPSFVADVPGTYVAQLIVSDASLASAPATVTVTATTPNRAPVAAAGATPSTVNVGSAVALSSAGSSDPDGNPLSFAWSLASRPAGSNAAIVAPGAPDTSVVPDLAGSYTVQLTVSDGSLSATALVTVTADAVSGNRPPVIVTQPSLVATVGAPYVYDIDASDPDAGDTLSHALTAAPAGMSINPTTGLISWAPTPAQVGAHAVTVRVADAAGLAATQSFSINVSAAPTPLQLAATLAPEIANAGDAVTLTVLVSGGNGGAVTRAATLDGTPLALNSAGVASFTAPAAGVHIVNVTATGSPVNGSTPAPQARQLLLTVRNSGDATAPVASITSPAADSEILAPVPVRGTASDANLAYYQLLLRPAGTGDAAWVEFHRGLASVTNNVLGTLDPARINNGVYELGLNVVDVNGRSTATLIAIEISRDRKVGQFRLSFTDIRAQASGMPLTLTRTYDSLKKDIHSDFGWGWSADASDVSVRKNMVLGSNWQLQTQGFNQCLRMVGNRRVTITLPDGGVYRFQARNEPVCALAVPPEVNIVFDPLPLPVGGATGATAGAGTLEIANIPSLVDFRGGMLFDWDLLQAWDPTDFIFTSAEGVKYTLREGVGVLSMADRYGNTVSYGPGGYQHNASLGVQLSRDGQGRITRATDPAGRSLDYSYNPAGELVSVTDRLGQTTHFQYSTATRQPGVGDSGSANSAHLLSGIIDPRGVLVMRQQFDEFGRLSGNADGNGATATQTFDEANNQQRVGDRRGNATTYTFDAAGNITRVVDAKGGVTDLTYDANGNELTRRDPLGHTVTKTYDATSGKQLTETDALGRVTTTTYPAVGKEFDRQNPISITDPLGRVTSIGYRAGDTLPGAMPTSITEPLGRVTNIGTDGKGNLASINVAGIATTYTYDSKGRRTSETDGRGATTAYTFDDNGNELTRTVTRTVGGVPRTETVTRVYDIDNRLTQETDATGAVRRTTYDAGGRPTTTTDALGRETRSTYDANGRLVRTDFPDGTNEQTGYDANGNEISKTDRQGRVTAMVYDELNRLVQTRHPDGSAASNEYDAAGRLVAEVSPVGARTLTGYDAAGQLTSHTDASSRRTEHSYDLAGNRTQTRLPDGRLLRYTYDALNRLTRTDFPDGSTLTTTYRSDGRKATETDPRGVLSTFGYDTAGQLISVVQSGIATATTYSYDQTGAKTVQTDALARQVQWRYDAAGRPVSRTLPDGSIERFSYDAEGQLTGQVTFGGQTITRGYDAQGREVSRSIPAAGSAPARLLSFTYTASGLRASQTETGATSSQGTTTYAYDAQDRLVQMVSPQGTLAWQYDAAGRITQRTTSEGSTGYQYDGDGRLAQMTAPDGRPTTYSYDAAGRLVGSEQVLDAVAGIKLVTHKRLDAQDRPVVIAHSRQVGGAAPTLIAGQAIARGAGGAVSRIDTFDTSAAYDNTTGAFSGNPMRVQTFGYDANARLNQENNYKGAQLTAWLANNASPATQATAYAYDQVGNRTAKTLVTAAGTETTAYAYDSNDRLVTEVLTTSTGSNVTTSYGWDGNGNLASRTTPSAYTGYVFDADNRLVEVRRGASPGSATVVAAYGYDANGQRISKTTPAGTTRFLIDPTTLWPQVVLESRGSERLAYVWGDSLRQQTRGGQGTLFGNPGEDLVPLAGHLDAPIAAINSSGSATETSETDSFGEPADANPRLNHQFAGEYWDADLAQIYLRERWYQPATGRFSGPDPIAGADQDARTLNRYAYAFADPLNRVDPSGQMSLGEMSAALNIQVNIALTAVRSGFAASAAAGGMALRNLGMVVESAVGQILTRLVGTGAVRSAIPLVGPGGRRVIDFMIQMGNRVAYLEVKYGLPRRAGPALTRLVGQIRTGVAAAAQRDGVFVLFTWNAPSQAQMTLLATQLGANAGFVQHIHGLFGLTQWVRLFFMGV